MAKGHDIAIRPRVQFIQSSSRDSRGTAVFFAAQKHLLKSQSIVNLYAAAAAAAFVWQDFLPRVKNHFKEGGKVKSRP